MRNRYGKKKQPKNTKFPYENVQVNMITSSEDFILKEDKPHPLNVITFVDMGSQSSFKKE